jgi:DNA invertase Pin-like site-specific DNA recombinase
LVPRGKPKRGPIAYSTHRNTAAGIGERSLRLGQFSLRHASLLGQGFSLSFDVVMAWSVDRLGRSLQDLVTFLSELHAASVDLFLHQQGLNTTTPAGKALFQMMGVFAEFERSMIQERVRAGLRRAVNPIRSEGRRIYPSRCRQVQGQSVNRAAGRSPFRRQRRRLKRYGALASERVPSG